MAWSSDEMTEQYEYASVRFYESELEGVAIDLLSGDTDGMKYIYTPAEDVHREIDEVFDVKLMVDGKFYSYMDKSIALVAYLLERF